jgi:hypothetical protein
MVDGMGTIWRPRAVSPSAVWDYTFGTQVLEPYDFAASIRVCLREFAPDCLIVLGPGDTLGGAVAQALIGLNWRGLSSKGDFTELQKTAPFLLSMGRADQRSLVT